MKNLYLFILIALFSVAVHGQNVWSAGTASNWATAENWSLTTVPTAADEVIFGESSLEVCTVDADAVFGRLRMGRGGDAEMIIKTGVTMTGAGTDWNAISENSYAKLTVEAGATLDLGNHHAYFSQNGGTAEVYLYGKIKNSSSLGLDRKSKGGIAHVIIYEGGELVSRYVSDNSFGAGAKLDIRGGTLRMTQDESEIADFIAQGKILAYGGAGTLTLETVDMGSEVLHTVVTSSPDATPPTIASSSPADAEIGVPNARPIVINFSKWMDNASVEAALTISPAIVNPTYTWVQNTLTIAGDGLVDLTVYTVTIGTGATDVNGIAVAAELSFTFTTIDPAAPPIIVTTVPADSATDINEGAPIVVNFSKEMDHASTELAITAVPALVNPIFTWSADSRSVSIAHDNAPWEQVSTVTVAAGAKAGSDETVLAAEYTFTFTVRGQPLTTTVWNPLQDGTSDGLWTTAENWTIGVVADGNYKVVLNVAGATAAILSDSVNINNLKLGDGGPGDTLIIKDKGYLKTNGEWNGFGYNGDTSVVIIETGGTLDLSSHAWIGYHNESLGKIDVYGTFFIRGSTGLDWADDGGKGIVTVHEGGVLNIRSLNDFLESGKSKSSINAGSVIDIDGGEWILNRHQKDVVKEYAAADPSRITAFGGDGILRVVQDYIYTDIDTTDITTITSTMVANSDATLSEILYDSIGTLAPAFDPAVDTYTLTIPIGEFIANVGGVANDPYAAGVSVTEDGLIILIGIEGVAVITVTAEDLSTKDYTVNITATGEVTSVQEQSIMNSKAYYIPSHDMVRIENASSLDRIRLVDITGKVRLDRKVSKTETIELNAAGLNHGIYIIQMISSDEAHSTKFVK